MRMSMELTLHGMIRSLRTWGDGWSDAGPHRRARVLARLRARREAESARRAAGRRVREAEEEGEGGRDGRDRA